jgi:hypothetical protein
LQLSKRAGVTIAGAGQNRTTLFSPRGVISVGIAIAECPAAEVRHLKLAGNVRLDHGWGLDLRFTTQESPPQCNYALDFIASKFCVARDLIITYPWLGAGAHNCERCTFRRLSVSTDGLHRYVSWMINWVNSTDCWSYDCNVKSTYVTKAFECFASNYCGHIRPRTVNGVFALNSTGHCVILSPVAVFSTNSVLSQLSIPFPGTYIVDVSTNINQNAGQSSNAILNFTFIQNGYLTRTNDVMIGVNVSGKSRDTLIKGGTYVAPSFALPSTQYGAQAVNSDAQNTIVQDLVVKGLSKGTGRNANIYVADGSVTNCLAETIGCAGPACVARVNRTGHAS